MLACLLACRPVRVCTRLEDAVACPCPWLCLWPTVCCPCVSSQTANAAVVMNAIKRVKDVDAAVEALDLGSCDILMKYLYRGMRVNVEDAGLLLRWHGIVTKRAGVSCIVRVLADRKTL